MYLCTWLSISSWFAISSSETLCSFSTRSPSCPLRTCRSLDHTRDDTGSSIFVQSGDSLVNYDVSLWRKRRKHLHGGPACVRAQLYAYQVNLSYSRQLQGSQWGSIAAARSLEKPNFLLQVTRESVSVLQVTRKSVSSITSHVCASERAMKSKVKSLSPQYQAIPDRISPICCCWHCYLCCTPVTIQVVTNL